MSEICQKCKYLKEVPMFIFTQTSCTHPKAKIAYSAFDMFNLAEYNILEMREHICKGKYFETM